MSFWAGRTVVYETACEQEIDRLRASHDRMDEALSGLEWAISNKPESFPLLYGSKLRMATISSAPGVPELRVWFTFTANRVNVIFVEECEEDGG